MCFLFKVFFLILQSNKLQNNWTSARFYYAAIHKSLFYGFVYAKEKILYSSQKSHLDSVKLKHPSFSKKR